MRRHPSRKRLSRVAASVFAAIAMVAMPTFAGAQQTIIEPVAPAVPPAVVVEPPVVVPPQAPAVVLPQAPAASLQAAPTAPGGPAPLKSVIKTLRSGPLLIHGNYCGIGNRPGKPPIDALDAACMRHDACTNTGKLPSCACDDRLRAEASAIAHDPRTSPDIRLVASATAASMAVLICKVAPSH